MDLLRSSHILCVCILLGGLYFRPEATQIRYWLAGVIITGLGLLIMEIFRNAAMLIEIRGIAVLIKMLLLLGLTQVNPGHQISILMVIVFSSALISHSPRYFRHYSVLSKSWAKRLNISQDSSTNTKL